MGISYIFFRYIFQNHNSSNSVLRLINHKVL